MVTKHFEFDDSTPIESLPGFILVEKWQLTRFAPTVRHLRLIGFDGVVWERGFGPTWLSKFRVWCDLIGLDLPEHGSHRPRRDYDTKTHLYGPWRLERWQEQPAPKVAEVAVEP